MTVSLEAFLWLKNRFILHGFMPQTPISELTALSILLAGCVSKGRFIVGAGRGGGEVTRELKAI